MKSIAFSLLETAISWLFGAVWRVIKAAVALQEQSELTGAEKRERVFAHVKAEALAMGAVLSDSLINLGIEAAVQLVRRSTAK